jgi:hypothetical protein
MMRTTAGLFLLLGLGLSAAHATGMEMGPRGVGLLLVAGAAIAGLQLTTLVVDALLPRTWSRARRWLVAILVPPALLVAVLVTIGLLA